MSKKKKFTTARSDSPHAREAARRQLMAAGQADEDAESRAALNAAAQSTAALYVSIPREQLSRYKRLADLAGMTLREYVTRALESFAASQSLAGLEETSPQDDEAPQSEWSMRRLNAHALRLGAIEKQLDALQRRVDQNWGPDDGLRPVRASDTLNKLNG